MTPSTHCLLAAQQIRRHPDRVPAVLAHLPRDRQQIRRAAQAGQLDQHRQVDAGDHLDAVVLEKRHAEVRRRAAEHVGQQQHALLAAHPLDRLRDLLPRVVHIVVPADRHRGELRQVADDHLGGVHQLGRELPVRDDDDANHRSAYRIERGKARASRPSRHARCPGAGRAPARRRHRRARARSRSAIITDRCRPPVQPIAIVR